MVGASDIFEARCRRCFEPGIPKQTELDFFKGRKASLQPPPSHLPRYPYAILTENLPY